MANMISTFPKFMTSDSLFQKMVEMGAPWSLEVGKSMDVSFFTMYSGLKNPTAFVLSNTSNGIPDSQFIAEVMWDIFGLNWKRLWDAYQSEYNPLDNYSVTETVKRDETDDRSIDKTGSLSSTIDGTNKHTYSDTSNQTLEHGHTVNMEETVDSNVTSSGTSTLQHGHRVQVDGEVDDYNYGFNSTEKVPTGVQISSSTEDNSGTDTTTTSDTTKTDTTQNSTQTNSGTDTTTYTASGEADDASKDVRADTTAENTTDNAIITETIERNRSGNIGQNSYQELLQQQFELWKWNYFWQVFEDADRFLCLSVFDPCSVNWTK